VILTFAKAIEILDELVEEKGENYVYRDDPKTVTTRKSRIPAVFNQDSSNNCYYSHYDGTPGCIIGHLIHKLNPEFDLKSADPLLLGDALRKAGVEIADDGTFVLLARTQYAQDVAWPWGEAVARGKRESAA
jgi:hypothetical protein